MDIIYFLGRFHVLALHLPIGIILAVITLEWLARKEKYRHLESAATFLWGAAAITSIATVILGYMHFAEGGFDGSSGTLHRLLGTSVAVVTTLVWMARSRFHLIYSRVQTAVAAVLLVLVTLTGHYGGNLTHGSDYLVRYAPFLGSGSEASRVVTHMAEAEAFRDVIHPMLELRCSSCHGEDTQKGRLSFATYESTMAGGENFPAVVPGDLQGSEMYHRITLPPDSEDYMPAEGKTPLTPDQVRIIRWWIEAGAPEKATVGSLNPSPEVAALIERELKNGGKESS